MKCMLNLVTPFTESNEIDFEALENYLDLRLSYDFSAIILGRKTGEFSSMDDEEILSVLEFVLKKVDKKLPVYIQTGLEDNKRSMILSIRARMMGAEALILEIPRGSKTGIEIHLRSIAMSANLPCYIESKGEEISFLKELIELPNIVGVIESSEDILQYIRLKEVLGSKKLICSNEYLALPATMMGVDAYISEMANILPEECLNMCLAYNEGRIDVAKRMYTENLELLDALNVETSPIPLKTAMNMLKYEMGEIRLPLSPLQADNAAMIANMFIDKNIKKV